MSWLRFKLGVVLLRPWIFAELEHVHEQHDQAPQGPLERYWMGRFTALDRLWLGRAFHDAKSERHRP